MTTQNGNPYHPLFLKQKAYQFNSAKTTCKQRIATLKALKRAIEIDYRAVIIEALHKDLGKPRVESEMTEIYQVIKDIKHVMANLRQWMHAKKVATPLSMLGTSSQIIYEPKGVCLILSPWNFPINLTFGPLISAIAAGNTVILKPSEMAPHTSAVMKRIVEQVFKPEQVVLVEGGVETARQLLALPFNHIFFTGSPTVGKIVMTAAAKHLASVTLELGGKSPTIIDQTANLKIAAKRIVWGKFLNCGQTCIAPDYILVHHSIKDAFIEHCKTWLAYYYDNPQTSTSYGRIVTPKHYQRLLAHLEDAKRNGATINVGGTNDAESKYMAPTIISGVSDESTVLQDEIFGPILPILNYDTIDEAIAYINKKERPLALYIFSKHKKTINTIIKNTRAGGTCINNTVIHYSNPHLPFGGINNSGIGKSHGYFGFLAFSNQRAIAKQYSYGIAELLYPPYTDFKEKLAQLTIKWF